MGYIESQRAATARYNKKAYDVIGLRVKKGQRAKIKAFAQSQGKSVNALINELLEKAMHEEGDA